MTRPPRIVFAGESTPLQKTLDKIPILEGLDLAGVFTRLDREKAIEKSATKLGMERFELATLADDQGLDDLMRLEPDWLLNVNSTIVYPESILLAPRQGALNMHPGRLPDYAGLHTHQWAIRNGEEFFASTLHYMTPQIDAGDIVFMEEFPVSMKDTGLSLFIKCLNAGVETVVKALRIIAQGSRPPGTPQDIRRRKLYTHKLSLDGDIRWDMTARQVFDFIRAAEYSPFECPTYQPCFYFHGRRFIAGRAGLETGSAGGRPGQVMEISEDGLVAAAGDKQWVRIKKITTPEKETIRLGDIESRLGITTGSLLS